MTNEFSDYYFNVGRICCLRKDYPKALDYYNKGLKIDQDLGNKFNLAGDYNKIGELYFEMDNLAQADTYFSKSIAVSKEINAYPESAATYRNLGLLYEKKGRRDKAKEYLIKARDIYGLIDANKRRNIEQEILELSSS